MSASNITKELTKEEEKLISAALRYLSKLYFKLKNCKY
jgi:hypothetical protein